MADFPVIDGYKIKKKLGHGGMATVYLAVPEKLNRLVAIKILSPLAFENPRILKRFTKEARTLSSLNHPNIVAIYEIGDIQDCHYIVMEYFQDSLKERIKKDGNLLPEEALHIASQIADALFYAHQKNIIHRDVKPDNIMFRQDGTPVILDFGIAKQMDSNTKITRTGTSIGTPQYMSPEQCNAEKLDGRSDIYSLGVVLYEMLTGRPPYTGDTTMAIINQHLQQDVPLLPNVLHDFQPIIDRMMAKERKKRVRTRENLHEIIKQLLNANNGRIRVDIPEEERIPAKSRKKTVNPTSATVTQIKDSASKRTRATAAPNQTTVKKRGNSPRSRKTTKKKGHGMVWGIGVVASFALAFFVAPIEFQQKLLSVLVNFFASIKAFFSK